jgi:acyl carrier protein
MTSPNGTTPERALIVEIVISGVREALALAENAPDPASLSEATRLIGEGAILDSLGLVTAVLEIEQRLAEQHDLVLVLADERAMSQKHSPFRSVGALADYVLKLAAEQGAHA